MRKRQKRPALTGAEQEKLYEMYDESMRYGRPDYKRIINYFLKCDPPVVLSRPAISYWIGLRKRESQAQVETARQSLDKAKQEHFLITGEQPQELDFADAEEINEYNAAGKLKMFQAKNEALKYEQARLNYTTKHEVEAMLKTLYSGLRKALVAFVHKIQFSEEADLKVDYPAEVQKILSVFVDVLGGKNEAKG